MTCCAVPVGVVVVVLECVCGMARVGEMQRAASNEQNEGGTQLKNSDTHNIPHSLCYVLIESINEITWAYQ